LVSGSKRLFERCCFSIRQTTRHRQHDTCHTTDNTASRHTSIRTRRALWQSKRRFYRCFGGFFLCWFLFLPLQVFIAHFLDPWVRRKSVEAISVLLTWLGFLLIPFLSNPRQAYELYHDRKTLGNKKVPSLSKMQRIIPSLSGFEVDQFRPPEAAAASGAGSTPSSQGRSEHFERALQQSYQQAQQQLAHGGNIIGQSLVHNPHARPTPPPIIDHDDVRLEMGER
jgi:hypothetical protein